MALTRDGARQAILDTLEIRNKELPTLRTLWQYRRGRQEHPMRRMATGNIPQETMKFLEMSRVNMVKLVIDVLTQSMYVVGYRTDTADTDRDDPAWDVYQANDQESRQVGLHRAAFTFGASYSLVLPGDPVPVIRNRSPLGLTAVYSPDDDTWPIHALEVVPNGEREFTYRLFDEANVWTFTTEGSDPVNHVDHQEHGAGVVPVVRFVNVVDTDDDGGVESEVEPLIPIQDQIDVTAFQLEVVKHFQAFLRQYIIGWTTDDEAEKRMASASRFLTFEDPDVTVGQLAQAQLDGFLRTEDSKLRHLAVISQTPPHHLLGELVNISAEALTAAQSGHRRKVSERQRSLGGAHKQRFALINRYLRRETDLDAEVWWDETEARSFAATVDGLGKLAQMLHIPPQQLWDMVPGVTQRRIRDWKEAAASGDSLSELARILDGQAAPLG